MISTIVIEERIPNTISRTVTIILLSLQSTTVVTLGASDTTKVALKVRISFIVIFLMMDALMYSTEGGRLLVSSSPLLSLPR